MQKVDFNDKEFKLVSNSRVFDIGSNTVFSFCQAGDLVFGKYRGGKVREGSFVAKFIGGASLEQRFQHLNNEGELIAGSSHSTTEVMPDGRLRIKQQWQLSTEVKGSAILEEVRGDQRESTDIGGNKFSWIKFLRSRKDAPVFSNILTK